MLNFDDTMPVAPRSDTFWPPRHPLPHCTGDCNQGRKPCNTRDACELADPDEWEPMTLGESLVMLAYPIAAVCAVAVVAAGLAGWL